MRIKRAEFITSLTGGQHIPGGELPQIAVVGKVQRGQVLADQLPLQPNKLARVSGEPGRRLINLYRINDAFYLVDLPGYGYARVSRGMQEDWGRMMDALLCRNAVPLLHILHLVDMRHEPGANDVQMQAWIQHNGVPCTVVATKCDKLSRAQQQKAALVLCRTLGVQPWDVQPSPP